MGYRTAETNITVQLVHLRLNAAQMAHCQALRREAGRCWTALVQAHLASRAGLWLDEGALKTQFKGQFALHSQTVQALAEKLIANVETARELRKTDPDRLRNKRHTALNIRLKRCVPNSRRHKKLLRSKARASAKFYRQGRDVLHKASRQLVTFAVAEQVAHLAVGDVRDIADGTDKGRQQNQRLSQWAHGQFVGYIKIKARQCGISVEYIPEDYSTRTCSVCRYCHRAAPRGRVFTCSGCGAIVSRDGNGAANICSRYRYGEYGQVQVQALTYLRATAVVPRTRAKVAGLPPEATPR